MNRRTFIALTTSIPFLLAFSEDEKGLQTFGFYEGLTPTGTRNPNRIDGTSHNMPCIHPIDVRNGEDKEYEFWHGHSEKHRFTVTTQDFEKLRFGLEVEIYTTTVDGHRHALLISQTNKC